MTFNAPDEIPSSMLATSVGASASACSLGIPGWSTIGNQEDLTTPAFRSSAFNVSISKGLPGMNVSTVFAETGLKMS